MVGEEDEFGGIDESGRVKECVVWGGIEVCFGVFVREVRNR